ncbi:sigma 54-interacting transcriptional regulator [Lutibacter sp. B2]|nr:sigma 54-interacting transcriptional regulator [Lutibacter sp. B2]
MSEGFIFIDENGKIEVYNEKAKEIFGITNGQGIGHDIGKIQQGDIVIIADNCLGRDDGFLKVEDLSCIGIKDYNIKSGDALIAVGVFGDQNMVPVYKYEHLSKELDELRLDTFFKGISAHIDFTNKLISITVYNQVFKMQYINAIGYIVVLDGKTNEVKFYQEKGYTARGESARNLLLGKEFRAKGKNAEVLNVIGKNIFEIHDNSSMITDFYQVACGLDLTYKDKFIEINGIPTLCTLVSINEEGKRMGAVLKVEDISVLKKVIKERDQVLMYLEQMEKTLIEKEQKGVLFPEILGESKKITHVKELAYKASKSNSTVLLLGESGTGKTLFAKAIHQVSKYKDNPFIHVNCASIPKDLLESELFGYEKGSFTGARGQGKIGLFEAAQGGTIFLDEIGEMTPFMQVKLLKVLQNKTFFRIGGIKEISVDVRIIAATNKNLEQEMVKGTFREDLYYRINVFPIWIPPLKERKEDIYSIVNVLLPQICHRIECEEKTISGEALYRLMEYDWPGNIRELENVLERAVNISEGNIIYVSHLFLKIVTEKLDEYGENIGSLKDYVHIAEKKAIIKALEQYKYDKNKVMEVLKIGKTSFYDKLKRYNIK